MRWAFRPSFTAAVVAIVLGTVAAVISAAFPGQPIAAAVVGGITGLALLIRQEYDAPELPDDGAGD